jgi:hypothetical protein
MIERARDQIRRLGTRADALGDCPVCGKRVKVRQDPIKAWAGKYAHGDCASYVRRSERGRPGVFSQRVYERFTKA